ncbi:MAG: phosphoribosylanthranilate isomerase [Bacteroidales bacterium]|nr:phosphoribosylanthranilate isomerase [Bacteroidales bacterium]
MKKSLLIKVCGMRDAENIRAVEALGIDMMGFIFYEPSARNVLEVPAYLPENVKRVGVFVNSSIDFIVEKCSAFQFDIVQLHGTETPEFCKEVATKLQVEVMKAFSLATKDDFAKINEYEGTCSRYVFDTKTPKMGGSGQKFDWNLLENYKGKTPFLLSGGIDANSVNDVLQLTHSQLVGLDLNSKFEISPALKDVDLLRQFITEIRKS